MYGYLEMFRGVGGLGISTMPQLRSQAALSLTTARNSKGFGVDYYGGTLC